MKWSVIGLAVSVASAVVAGESRVVFKEGFDGAAEKPAGYTDACAITEAPGSLKALAFRPADNKPAEVHKGFFPLPKGAPACADYSFAFKFLFPRDSKKALSLTLVSGDRADKKKPSSSVVTISEKAMSIKPDKTGLFPPFGGNDQELDIAFFPHGLWHRALVTVRGGTLELFVENDGILKKFGQAEVSVAPLIGFNFAGATAFDLDDIDIRRLDPPDAGDFRDENGLTVANRAAEYKMVVPDKATLVSAGVRLGTYPGSMTLKLGYADGSERLIDAKTFAAKYDKAVARSVNELDATGKLVATTKTVRVTQVLTDAGLNLRERVAKDPKSAWAQTYWTRPRMQYRYEAERELEIAANWDRYPAASRKFIKVELRPDGAGAQFWLDGRYAGRFDSTSGIRSLSFVLPAGGAIRDVVVTAKPLGGKYLALDVNAIANPGALAGAKVVIGRSSPGEQMIEGMPFIVTDGPGNADTGVCRENLGSTSLECDGYLARTPFDGMPESLLLSVPVAQYTRAWCLCAVEDDPDKVPVITARLTKFLPNSEVGRGPAIADTAITLPRLGEALPPGVKQVGEVKAGGKSLPLYLVEFKMDTGNIQEIIFQEKPAWLDFEVLGKRYDKDNFYLDRSRKPADDISGVHVFGATLERSPVEMQIMPAVFGNIYEPGETPAMSATLRATEKAAAKLAWTVRDLHDKALEQGSRELAFAQAGEEIKIDIPFAQQDLGWYRVDYALAEKGGRALLEHTAYFARIDKDTRQAGYESPYFTWNFHGAHGTIKDIAVSGPLLLKAGIRNTHVANEKEGAPWKLTMGQLPRLAPRSKDPAEAEKEIEGLIRNAVSNFPHASMALIFHESGGGPFPLELLGGKTELDDKQAAYDQAKADQAVLIAKAYRKVAPQIRLVVGNSGSATPGLLASLFRAKFPKEYLDFLGEESVGMTMPPELSVAKEFWILQETARVFGYGELPVSACYEWKCRRSRNLGLERYAEWNVRDMLIAHAWKSPLIPTVGLPDVSFSYYNTVWGDEAFTHNPQVYPKPSYPAVSTLTRVLDGATFVRMIPTGSRTVYALEFKRGGDFVYALWTARGEVDATLDFGREAALTLTGMYGPSSAVKTAGGTVALIVGEGAVYLSGPVALKAVTALGVRRFPREAVPAGAGVAVASPLNTADGWSLDLAADPRIDVPAKAPVSNGSFRKPGLYRMSAVKDDVKGDCLELELIQTNDCPALMQEYVFLKAAKPLALPGTPATIGLWVKGNSSWGKVFWEIEDAEGERWLSAGTGGYGCNVYDWPELAGLNFDGWHYLQFPITGRSPITVQSPGQDGLQWQHNGAGNRKIDYPIAITAVAVSMPRQTLNLLKMEPVTTVIRLAGLSAY